MDLNSLRQEQLSIFIANWTEYLNTSVANRNPWEISIPDNLGKQIDLLFPPLDKTHYECPISLPKFIKKRLIQGLMSMLGSDLKTWARLSPTAFVVMAEILLATESCLEKEQGLFYLMSVIENAEISRNDTPDLQLQEFKTVVGAHLLLPLYFEFVDFSKSSRSGRWAGLLLYHLIQHNDENVFSMKYFPSLWFKMLGRMIIEANDWLLKIVAGKLIAQILTSLELHWSSSMRCFWPPGMASYYVAFPENYLHKDWEQRLFEFISQVEKGQKLKDITGFIATNITIGDLEIQSSCSLVFLTNFLSVYIPRRGNLPPQWLDIKVCNVNIVDIYAPCTQDDDPTLREDERIVDLQISITDYLGEGYLFMNSLRPCKAPDKIAFTVKDILSDQYADAIERARDIARTSLAKPNLGQPLFDLELSVGAHQLQNDTQEVLQMRRERITSMADSPAVDKIIPNGNPAGIPDNTSKKTHANQLGCDGLDTRDLAIKPCGVAHSLNTFSDVSISRLVTNILSDPPLQPPPTKKTSNLDQTKPMNDGNINVLSKGSRHLYETDSEVSDLSEPPEELESIFEFSVTATNTQKNSNILIPRFKNPQKITERVTQVGFNAPISTQKPSIQGTAIENDNVMQNSKAANKASFMAKTEAKALAKTSNSNTVKTSWPRGKIQAEDKTMGKNTTPTVKTLPIPTRQSKSFNSTHENKPDIYDLPSDNEEPLKTSKKSRSAPRKPALVGKCLTTKKPTPKPMTTELVKNNPRILLGKNLHVEVPQSGAQKGKIIAGGLKKTKTDPSASTLPLLIAKSRILNGRTNGTDQEDIIQPDRKTRPRKCGSGGLRAGSQANECSKDDGKDTSQAKPESVKSTIKEKLTTESETPAMVVVNVGKSFLDITHNSRLTDEFVDKKIEVKSPQGGYSTLVHEIGAKEVPVFDTPETGKTKKKKQDEPLTKRVKKNTGLNKIFSKAPVRIRRAAAKVALTKLKQRARSSKEHEEHEEEVQKDTKVCDASEHEKGPPNPQNSLPSPQREGIIPNEDLKMLDAASGAACCSPLGRLQGSIVQNFNTPKASLIIKPENYTKVPRKLNPTPSIAKMDDIAVSRGRLNTEITTENVETFSIIEGKRMQGPQLSGLHALTGIIELQNTEKKGFVELVKNRQVPPQKPVCDVGMEKNKQISRPQLENSTLSHGTWAKSQVVKNVHNSTLTKVEAVLDPKASDVSLQTVLNKKPQIISWGKQEPPNQGRLIDISGLHKKHSDHKFSPEALSRIQADLEESPSQKVRAKKRTQEEDKDKHPHIEKYRRTLLTASECSMQDKENFEGSFEQPSSSVIIETTNNQVSDADLDERDSYHLPITFSDLPDAATGIHADLMSEDGGSTNGSAIDERLPSHKDSLKKSITDIHFQQSQAEPYERSPLDFIPSECDNYNYEETKFQEPKTPEGRRTDFWNNPGYVGNVDLWSGNSTDVEGWPQRIGARPPKRRTIKAVLSDDAVPILIKQCGSRIHPAKMEDPFIDRPAKPPVPNSFLRRLSIGAPELDFYSETIYSPSESIPPTKSKLTRGNHKRTAAETETVAHNTTTNPPPKRVKPNVQTVSFKDTTRVKSKAFTQTAVHRPIKVTFKTEPDPDKTLVSPSSPIYYMTSPSSASSEGPVNVVCDDDGASIGTAQRKAFLGNADDNLNIFPSIGKLFHKELRAQVSSAKSLLGTFETSALNKVDNLKRSRVLEFEEYTRKLDGPVIKKVKHMYEAAHIGLTEAVTQVGSSKGKIKASNIGRESLNHARAQEIEGLWRQRRERTKNTLRHVEKMY